MVKIKYLEGPEVLQDVSHETFVAVSKMLKGRIPDKIIAEEHMVSFDEINEIRNIIGHKLSRCCFCGAIFDPHHSKRIRCYKEKHFLPCIDCGSLVEVKESYKEYQKAGGRRCPKCRASQIGLTRRSKSAEEKAAIVAKQQATMIERYGAATPLQVPEMKAKIQATVKEKYGVDNLSQSSVIQHKIRENSQAKYGVDHYTNAPEIRKKMVDGMIKKYGVATPQRSEEIRAKTKATNLERYGVENVFQSKEVRDTFVKRHRAKYGVDWPHQRPDLIEKVKQTNIKKYGAAMYPISDEFLRTLISDPSKFDAYKAFRADPEKYIKDHYSYKPSVKQLSDDLGVTDSPIYDRLVAIGKRDLATESEFSMETELKGFIASINPDITVVSHDRKILGGKEIDVYLPDYHIGFECNPTYTHNSTFRDPWGSEPTHPSYHAEKSLIAADNGVFLYHIFGYEWTHNRSKVQSQIRNLLGANSRKLYARKTVVQEISFVESKAFLEINHRQGFAQSSIRLGLRDVNTDELVSVMTFGRMRSGIGRDRNTSEGDWELVRFCNLQDTTVVGGASKLLKYFKDHFDFKRIVSFSDIAHTRGNLYELLGFKVERISSPGYVWVNLKTDEYFNRVSCQKANLPNLFDDVDLDDINTKTEDQIMAAHGYAKVYDSGVIRWELRN